MNRENDAEIIVDIADVIAPAFKDVHLAVIKEKYTHIWLKGGRSSTKSSVISIEMIRGIMAHDDANGVVLRKIAANLRDTVLEQYLWAIEALQVAPWWICRMSPMQLIYKPTGQSIKFRGADEPRKLKSMKFHIGQCRYIHYEELDEFAPEDIRSINQTLMRGGSHVTVFYSYNPPKSVQSWVNSEAGIQRADRLVHHSSYLDIPKEWLGEQFIIEAEHLKATRPESYRHEYLGEVTGTGGEVFANVKGEEITDAQIGGFDNILRGLDFGYAVDPLAYGEMHYDSKHKRLYIFREIYAVGMKNSVAVGQIKPLAGNRQITADSAEPRTINEFRELGLYGIQAAIKGPDSVEHGIKFLQDLEQIIIDPARCPNAYREFCQYELERDKDGNFKAQFPDKNNHTIDMVRYAMERYSLNRSIKFI